MVAMRKITVEVPEDVARRLERRLAAGGYADESAIVTASLTAQLDQDESFERWTGDDLQTALADWRAAPDAVRPAAEVFDGALARYEARKAREA